MEADADVRAFDAVASSPRAADLARVARAVLLEMARGQEAALPEASRVGLLAREFKLSRQDADTPFGNALDVLQHGPHSDPERVLARALAGHALLVEPEMTEFGRLSSDLLRLAARTPFDATGMIDRAAGEGAAELWRAIAERLQRVDAGQGSELARGEALVAAAALASARDADGAARAAGLAQQLHDPAIAQVLLSHGGTAPRTPEQISLRGEMSSPPRGALSTAVLAGTGLLAAWLGAKLFARLAFGYRKPAEVLVSADGGVRVRWRAEILGRTIRDGDVSIPRASMARATREVLYPRLLVYVGMLSLSVGSYFGVAAFVDGLRAASPSLLATGLAVVCLGLAVDFILSSLAPSSKGTCRVVIVSRQGPALCVRGVDIRLADALLSRLAEPSGPSGLAAHREA